MIEVIGGDLYQWDISRSVRIKPEQGKQVQKANFSNADIETARVTSAVKDGDYYIAEIPDELLKSDQKLTCYAVMIDPDEEKTIEQASFKVNRRNRPDDYDINASTELRSLCDDILGEVVGNTIFDKLAYMKDCLDILYQSPPIKLMREVYGENKSLKELFEHISKNQSEAFTNVTGKSLEYSVSDVNTGFAYNTVMYERPNGTIGSSANCFIAPSISLYPYNGVIYFPITISRISANYSGTLLKNTIIDVDLSNIEFRGKTTEELYKIGTCMKFSIICSSISSVRLPRCSYLMQNAVLTSEGKDYTLIENGIHLGQVVFLCMDGWLFGNNSVDPSLCKETPVYCDKDFYVNGTMQLEKLNIPLDCIIEFMVNAIYVPEGFPMPTLSIGNFNVSKLFAHIEGNMQEEDFLLLESIMEKVENDEITLEDGIKQIKQMSYYFGVYFEFEHVKGWKLQ